MNNEIDWLCHLGVKNHIYEAAQVKALYEISPEGTSLMDFAQATLDNGFTADVNGLQVILEQSVDFAREQGPCPHSVLISPGTSDTDTKTTNAELNELDQKALTDTVVGENHGVAGGGNIFQTTSKPVLIDTDPSESLGGAITPLEMLEPLVSGKKDNQITPHSTPSVTPSSAVATGTSKSHSPGAYQHVSTSHTYPFDIAGFPDLSQVQQDPSQAKKLLKTFFRYARSIQASDIHISSASYPHIRRFSKNYLIDNQPVLSVETARILNMALASKEQIASFEKKLELDYSVDFGDRERYRVNVMKHFRGYEGSYRIISSDIKSLRNLGFAQAEILEKLTTYHQGLILVTGPAGCGKTTTLASMVDLINKNREDHIITVEDPVEIIIESTGCNVSQRELNSSTKSFANALRAALREDPDIIVIGEMRDLETIEMAISAAETGHLVIGTLHTSSASSTLDRLLDVFPPSQQAQIRAMLAESLKGIICQRLLPNKDGSGLLMAPEVLIGTLAVANIIKDGSTYQLASIIETGGKKGMISAEDSMINLYKAGLISFEQAKPHIRTNAKLRQLEAMENAGGAAAYTQQQTSLQNRNETKKKGWFK